jgi:hypothetical protein
VAALSAAAAFDTSVVVVAPLAVLAAKVPTTVVPTTTRSPACNVAAETRPANVTVALVVTDVIVPAVFRGVLVTKTPVTTGGDAALAAVANAIGSAAAISTAPAARALTMWRGIRRKVFIKNPSLVVVFIFHSLHIF